MQTDYVQTKEEELQTYIDKNDMETLTEIETKNVRIQTPQPVIEQKCIQTEDLVSEKSIRGSNNIVRIFSVYILSQIFLCGINESMSNAKYKDTMHLPRLPD